MVRLLNVKFDGYLSRFSFTTRPKDQMRSNTLLCQRVESIKTDNSSLLLSTPCFDKVGKCQFFIRTRHITKPRVQMSGLSLIASLSKPYNETVLICVGHTIQR